MAFCKYCGRELQDGEICNCNLNKTVSAIREGAESTTTAVQYKSSEIDFSSFLGFIKTYILHPNKAVKEAVQKKDLLTIIITAVFFLVNSILVQCYIGIKAHSFSFLLIVFGIIFAILLAILPAASTSLLALLKNKKCNIIDVLLESLFHLTATSTMFFITFLFGLPTVKLYAFFLVLSFIIYMVSELSVLENNVGVVNSTLGKTAKVIVGIVFAAVMAFFLFIEVDCALSSMLDSLLSDVLGFLY